MKEKLEQLQKSIKALLAEAGKLIEDGKLAEAKIKQDEIKAKRVEYEAVKAQVELADEVAHEEENAQLKRENGELKAAAKKPVRIEMPTGEVPTEKTETAPYALRYQEPEAAVKAVISDLYGSDFNYNQKRDAQMTSFSKYLRFGDKRLTLNDVELLTPSWKTLILRPEVIKSEIESGRSVAEIKTTLIEGSNDLGGYIVPEDFRTDVIKRLMGNTFVRRRARVITTTRDAVDYPRLEGGNTLYTSAVRVTWVEEQPSSATAAQTNNTWGMVKIPIHTVMARTDLSKNLIEDAAFNLLDYTSALFAEAMGIDEDNQFLTGTGGGTPMGVLGSRSGAELAPITGVTAVVSGSASAVTSDGLYDLVYTIASQYRNGASFAMARTAQRDIRKLKDGNSRYLWQDSFQAGQPPSLVGFPVDESESLPAVAANNHSIIFGNWLGYLVADRVGMSIQRVEDSTTVGQNKIALYARRRLGGYPVEPWRFACQKISA